MRRLVSKFHKFNFGWKQSNLIQGEGLESFKTEEKTYLLENKYVQFMVWELLNFYIFTVTIM